jgi:pimeloyl-ACP methyl ester carboxylesterase
MDQEQDNPADTPTTHQVLSQDGTPIGYRRLGVGPGLVILHGAARTSQHYLRLAAALAEGYTIILPDRRGCRQSGPAGEDYSIRKEVQDLSAVLQETGARQVFGHGLGGFIALESALALPIDRLVLYEPLVPAPGTFSFTWLPRLENALSRSSVAEALAIFWGGLRLNRWSRLPFWALNRVAKLLLKDARGQEIAGLLPGAARETRELELLVPFRQRYRAIQAEVMLLSGSKSPTYLRNAAAALHRIIPHAIYGRLRGFDHHAPVAQAPEIIGGLLKSFFSKPIHPTGWPEFSASPVYA